MNAYDLPTSLKIGEVVYSIRYGWRAVLDIFAAMNDPELDRDMKQEVLLKILYPDWQRIPSSRIPEALEKAREFLDCGRNRDDRQDHPRVMDWSQDASILIPAVNAVAKQEIRTDPNIHWWTFNGWYMSISEGLFATVVHVRQKKARGKPLDKWEEEFYRENRNLVDIQAPLTEEDRAAQTYFDKWLM